MRSLYSFGRRCRHSSRNRRSRLVSRLGSFARVSARGRFAFFHNQIWTDLSPEQAYTHNAVKLEYAVVLKPIVEETDRGHFFTDGMLLTNQNAGFPTIPDGFFITFESLDSGKVVEVAGKKGGCVEFVGTPEMVLEVVSESTEEKDLDFLALYFQAGVAEYWFVDVRSEPIRFEIYKRNSRRFVATRPQSGGWLKSNVFGRSFRLRQLNDPRGKPDFTLETKK